MTKHDGSQPSTPSMPESEAQPTPDDGAAVREAAARKARLDRIFGDVLPETTSDERARGQARRGDADADAWLRQNVPPHHG